MKGKRAGRPKPKAPRQGAEAKSGEAKDQAWFERKVAELKAELERLPAERQEQLRRELERGVASTELHRAKS